jgi:integrase
VISQGISWGIKFTKIRDTPMPLAEVTIRTAKPTEKPYKLNDGKGLYALINPNGKKYWRYKYTFNKKEKLLALGVYPEVSLKDARTKQEQARILLKDGIDPAEAKQATKRKAILEAENSFKQIALEWHTNRKPNWSERYANYVLKRLEKDIFPSLGHRPVNAITAPELLAVIRAIEARDVCDIPHRVLQTCGEVFRYAIAIGKGERDVAADLRGALKTVKKRHHAHLEEKELPEFLSKLEAYDGDLQTKLAWKFMLLTFVRTTELRGAKWKEINFDKAEWRIPAERMKMGELHIVPLSKPAIKVLEALKPLTGHREYIFPNSNRPATTFISENTLLYALYRMGYHSRATTHGFRATASTILNEYGFRSDVIERQLAHSERNKIRASYNHAQYLQERKEMMQWWADFLEKLAKVKNNN